MSPLQTTEVSVVHQRFTRRLQAYIWEVPSWILGLGGIIACTPLGLKALPHRQHIQGNDGNGHCMGRFTNCRVLWQGYKRQNPHLQTCNACIHARGGVMTEEQEEARDAEGEDQISAENIGAALLAIGCHCWVSKYDFIFRMWASAFWLLMCR